MAKKRRRCCIILNKQTAVGEFYCAQRAVHLRKLGPNPIYKTQKTNKTVVSGKNIPFIYMMRTPRYVDCTILGTFDANKFHDCISAYITTQKKPCLYTRDTVVTIPTTEETSRIICYNMCAVQYTQKAHDATVVVFGVCYAVRLCLRVNSVSLVDVRVKEGTPATVNIPIGMLSSNMDIIVTRVNSVHMPLVTDLHQTCVENVAPGKHIWAAQINKVAGRPVYAVVVQNVVSGTIQCIHKACQSITFESVNKCMEHYKYVYIPPNIRYTYVSIKNGIRNDVLDKRERDFKLCYERRKSSRTASGETNGGQLEKMPHPKKRRKESETTRADVYKGTLMNAVARLSDQK